MINTKSKVKATPKQVSSEFMDGEIVILNLNNGVYYGLDPVGARIWELLHETGSVRRIQEQLLEEFEVDPVRCESELLELLNELEEHGLVEVMESGPAA